VSWDAQNGCSVGFNGSKKKVRAALQNGLQEWVTVMATIGADDSVLPLALMYLSANCILQATGVAWIQAEKHNVFVNSTPTE
jgi:hypothetical protein